MAHLRIIPPITSTGNKRRDKPAKFDGLAHMSLGRYIVERKSGSFGIGNMQRDSTYSWDVSNHLYEKCEKKPVKTIPIEPKIECVTDVIDNFNGGGGLEVILQFKGLTFLNNTFTKSQKDYGSYCCVYFAPINYKNKEAYLILSTNGDIFEFEIVPKKKGVDQLFSKETYIPKLMENYNPLSMEVVQRNGLTIISYKRK